MVGGGRVAHLVHEGQKQVQGVQRQGGRLPGAGGERRRDSQKLAEGSRRVVGRVVAFGPIYGIDRLAVVLGAEGDAFGPVFGPDLARGDILGRDAHGQADLGAAVFDHVQSVLRGIGEDEVQIDAVFPREAFEQRFFQAHGGVGGDAGLPRGRDHETLGHGQGQGVMHHEPGQGGREQAENETFASLSSLCHRQVVRGGC